MISITLISLVSTLLGLILGFIFPNLEFIDTITNTVDRLGNYGFIPYMIFSTIVSCAFLFKKNKIITYVIKFIIIALLTLITAIMLSLIFYSFLPNHINTLTQVNQSLILEDIIDILLPSNPVAIFINPSLYTLPLIFVFSILFAYFLEKEMKFSQLIYEFFLSISHIFYSMNTFFLSILSLFLFSFSYQFFTQLNSYNINHYIDIIAFFTFAGVLILFLIIPALNLFILKEKNPFLFLKTYSSSLIFSFFIQNTFITLASLARESHQKSHIKRRLTGFLLPLLSFFIRGGTVFITILSFILLHKGYTDISLSLGFLKIFISSFTIAFLSLSIPYSSHLNFLLLLQLTLKNEINLELSYSNLLPITLFLNAIASTIDTAIIISILNFFKTSDKSINFLN